MSHFDRAIAHIFAHEGGYQCDPNDSGNWTGGQYGAGMLKGTKYGIAAASYPRLDIANITREQAEDIYHRDYWHPAWDSFGYQVAAKLFDIAVNCGTGTAAKLLQRACKVLDDGKVGPVTIAAAQGMDQTQLLARIVEQQTTYYQVIVVKDPRKRRYLKGWLARAAWVPEHAVA